MSFAEGFIRGHQQGAQEQMEQEQRTLQKMLLEHQLRQMKVDDQARAFGLAKQKYEMLQGQPAASLPGKVGPSSDITQVPGIGGLPMPALEKKFDTVDFPAVGDQSGFSLRPQSQEQIASAKQRDMLTGLEVEGMKPFTLPAGGTRVNPLTGQSFTAPKEQPPSSSQIHQGVVDGKPGFAIFDPKEPDTVINLATGQRTRNFVPTPSQAQQSADILSEDVKLTKSQQKIATDLSTGDLTFDQFSKMIPNARGGAGAALKAAIYNQARELNPNFNPAQFEIGYHFAANPKIKQQVASINNVISGVDDLLKFSDAAQRQGANILNRAILKGGVTFGGKTYNDFKTARIAFADELSGALGYGSATDMAKQMGLDLADDSMSPANFRSAIENVVVPFVRRKKASLTGEMGPYAPSDAGGQATGGAAAVQTPGTAPPNAAQNQALKVGTQRTINGVLCEWDGHGWFKVGG